MAQGSSGIGGFFTEKGELIDSKKLKSPEDTNRSQTNQTTSGSSGTPSIEDSQTLTRALGKVSERTRVQVDDATRSNDSAQQDVKQAREIVTQQRQKLQDIRQAEKDNASDEDIQKLKDEYRQIEKQRNALADEIDRNSRERTQQGARSIRVGNEQVGRIQPRAVSLSKSSTDLDSEDGIKAAIQETKDTSQSLKEQRTALKDERQEIKDSLSGARQKLTEIESKSSAQNSSVDSIDKAAKLAQETGDLIRRGGNAVVAHTLSPENVARLIGI